MVQSVLGSLILGYRPREPLPQAGGHPAVCAQRVVSRGRRRPPAAHHPEAVVRQLAPLLISAQSRQLLLNLLENLPGSPWIEVRGEWLADSEIYARVKTAHQRGLRLVWRGDIGKLPEPDVARCFDNSLLTLRPEDAVAALQPPPARPGTPARSVVLAGQMYKKTSRAGH